MNTHKDDIDVLMKPMTATDKKYVRSEDAAVYPPLASFCECELMVNEAGMAIVAFNKDIPEGVHWVEYDMDLSLLTFVTWSGSVMELGMKIHPPFRKYLKTATEIMMVQMSEDTQTILATYPADLVTRHIGI